MYMSGLKINKLNKSDIVPYNLLLLADPNKSLVDKYIKDGECYVVKNNDRKIVAVYVLINVSEGVLEIKNIAVDPKSQGQGYGKALVLNAIKRARQSGVKKIEIGTGNSSLSQLSLYQKCGFRIVDVNKDFFVKNYPEKIFEDGIQCVDMIRLAIDL